MTPAEELKLKLEAFAGISTPIEAIIKELREWSLGVRDKMAPELLNVTDSIAIQAQYDVWRLSRKLTMESTKLMAPLPDDWLQKAKSGYIAESLLFDDDAPK